MANSTEHDKEYQGIMNTIIYFGYAILLFHFYIYCNDVFRQLGFNWSILNNFIRSLNNGTHLFEKVWYSKLAAVFVLLIYVFGNKSKKNISASWSGAALWLLIGGLLYFGSTIILSLRGFSFNTINLTYTLLTLGGYMVLIKGAGIADSIINIKQDIDPFNEENESFMQETSLMQDEYSVNIPTLFYYKKKWIKGWINFINSFRALMVLGTPGSGKSFAIINNFIRQMIEKGFTMYIYDFKFPDLSRIAHFYLSQNQDIYKKMYNGKVPKFYTINFDDARRSHRCNPLLPRLMTDIIDADEAATTIMYNLNKSWIQKQGDFFVMSPIAFFKACIWYMKKLNDKLEREYLATLSEEERKKPGVSNHINYCTFPHIIEFIGHIYDEIFPLMMAEADLEGIIQPFFSALKNKAAEQLEGQIASARIPLSALASPTLYWVMTGNDFSLDINNKEDPKILCVGNNPDRQTVYGPALGLYNARLVKIINKKDQAKCALIVDELPTIYFRGLNNLIATGRSNRIATILALQDFSQLIADYGKEQATTIFNTIGNIISGQVVGETAKTLSSRFGKNVQESQSHNITEKEVTTNLSTKMDSVIPESKISNLSQGTFVGAIADNVGQEVKQKIFHAKIIVDQKMIDELKNLPQIPILDTYKDLTDEQVREMLEDNMRKIKKDVRFLIRRELDALRNGPRGNMLSGLLTEHSDYLNGIQEEEDYSEYALGGSPKPVDNKVEVNTREILGNEGDEFFDSIHKRLENVN